MQNRRHFLQYTMSSASLLALGPLLVACSGGGGEEGSTPPPTTTNPPTTPTTPPPPTSNSGWLMRDEGEPHKATWMAFAASEAIWGASLLNAARDAQARIAAAIVAFEPVNMLVRQADLAIAKQKLDPRVNLIVQEIDDLWMRDSGPVFVTHQNGERAGINFNFNGWGKKQTFANDAKVAGAVCQQAGVRMLSSRVVMEGGGIEVDGKGTAILTESCILNPNRNPGLSRVDIETELQNLLGIRKFIWLPGIAGKDITDGHIDFYARFARPGVVVAAYDPDPASYDHAVTKRNLEILRAATDAAGKPLQVVVLDAPSQVRPEFKNNDFAAGYINFYVVNGAVIAPEFGDAIADAAAKTRLLELFPGRVVVQVNIDAIAAGGGGIHCTTQQEPRS